MPVWIGDRGSVLVVTGHGIARSEGEGGPWEILRFSREGLRRDQEPPSVDALAVLDDRGESALFCQRGKGTQLWRRGKGVVPCDTGGREITTLARSRSGQLVVASLEGDDVALFRATLTGDALVLGARIEIPEAPRIASPHGFFVAGGQRPMWIDDRLDDDDDDEGVGFVAASLSHKQANGYLPGEIRLLSNRNGVGVTSTYNGLVAVLDPETLAPRLRVRVPTEWEQYQIFALPLARGAFVTVVANYRHTLFMYVDDDGKEGGARDTFGKDVAWGAEGPGSALADDRVLVSVESRPYVLTLPRLDAKPFGKLEGRIVEQASSADGKTHVVALVSGAYYSPHYWQMHRLVAGKKTVQHTDLEPPDFRPPPEPVGPPPPRKETGQPSFGLIAGATPWKASVGATTTVRVTAVNTGGPASGAWIELGGQAVTDGLVVPLRATVASHAVDLRGRTELPDLRLDAATVVDTKSKEPPAERPSIAIDVELRGAKAGKALLTIRVGPRGASGGSGLQGRTFEVS